ncbi:Gfo/Idh/MocA family protein [Terriglobus roseus]|uniref:Predicted dehydrogenase n=1 Tax=Terriglobus roseus TaxID=392734 RepID=A0A1H4MJ35_9BACT|nr:Gfo/Idh/MocA family oxidoreductase [Terriglobus roseus]SEB82535.1 Predicted dehydrogenase [Terriglobus roseus]
MRPNRRTFLLATGMSALASRSAFGANDRLRLGIIGAGSRMRSLAGAAERTGFNFEIAAVSDVYEPHREQVKTRPSATNATLHNDFHEVLDNKSIDAVLIATPDHWHVRAAVAALAAGKDVYLEKPVNHTLEEGVTLKKAVRSSKQILQCGMQQRSWEHFRDAVNLVQSGAIGRVTQIRTYWWQNYNTTWIPENIDTSKLDWKMWLGGAPDQPFDTEKYNRWRWYWSFGSGAMTDLFAHWIDVAHWAMKENEPTTAFMLGDKFVQQKWECPDTQQAALRYPSFDVVYEGSLNSSIDDGGLEFRGFDATLKLTRSGMNVYRERVRKEQNPVLKADSFQDGTVDHMQNFFDCMRSRKEPNAPVEAGVACANAGHIANLAYKQGGMWSPKRS